MRSNILNIIGQEIVKDNGDFSYSLGFGAGFTIFEAFTLNVGDRYHDMGRSEVLNKKVHFYSNDVYVGIRMGFWNLYIKD